MKRRPPHDDPNPTRGDASANATRGAQPAPFSTMDLDEYRRLCAGAKRAKYGNREAQATDGRGFASEAERKRYDELRLALDAGALSDLTLQPVFLLQAGFRDGLGHWHRAIHYVADFSYREPGNARLVVEEVKGFQTPVYRLKRKLFLYRYAATVDFRVLTV